MRLFGGVQAASHPLGTMAPVPVPESGERGALHGGGRLGALGGPEAAGAAPN